MWFFGCYLDSLLFFCVMVQKEHLVFNLLCPSICRFCCNRQILYNFIWISQSLEIIICLILLFFLMLHLFFLLQLHGTSSLQLTFFVCPSTIIMCYINGSYKNEYVDLGSRSLQSPVVASVSMTSPNSGSRMIASPITTGMQ